MAGATNYTGDRDRDQVLRRRRIMKLRPARPGAKRARVEGSGTGVGKGGSITGTVNVSDDTINNPELSSENDARKGNAKSFIKF